MIQLEIEIEDEAWRLEGAALLDSISAAVALALSDQGGGDVTVLLTSDDVVRDLNRQFRGKDNSTNVLSFPAAPSAKPHIGDIALAYGVCAVEAREQGKTLARHAQHLAAHGALHLVGYDHKSDDDALVMENKERAIMQALGAPDPYVEMTGSAKPDHEGQHQDG